MSLFLLIAAVYFVVGVPCVAQNSTPAPESTFRIAGTLVSQTDGHPLANARVILASVKARQNPQSVVTSDDGKFEFTGVPAGKFSLTGAKRGFISAGYEQHDQYATAIVTGAGLDTENLVLRLSPHALIGGRVLDEAGEAVRNASVTLYFDNHLEGVHEIRAFRSAQTNDLGNYEIDGLIPGTYYLSVSAQPWYAVHPTGQARSQSKVDPSLDVSYPLTYYGDVTEPESATPITVHGGEQLQLDLHLNPVPSLHLVIHLPASRPDQIPYPQLEQPSFEGSVPLGALRTQLDAQGNWDIAGVPAGKYDIRMMGPTFKARLSGVEVNGANPEVDASSGEAAATLKVSVSTEAPTTGQLNVLLNSKKVSFPAVRTLDSKGLAEFDDLSPGNYAVQVVGPGRPYAITKIVAEGAVISGHAITLTAGASASLSLSVGTGSAEVQGIAKRDSKPFSGAMVVLVPRKPEGNRDLFRRDQSDLDGTFAFHNVVPGPYTAVAIEDGWDLDWSQPELISAYATRGVALVVADQPGQNLNLSRAVEVQSK
jgi:hypothetical protein